MFVFSLSGKKIKLAGVAFLACMAVALSVFILPDYDNVGTAYVSAVTNEKISFGGIKSEDDRLEFIAAFGISVTGDPVEVVETKIPKEFDAVYNEYNGIQMAQGLDLAKYKGKRVKRYTYEVSNYPKDSQGMPSQVFLNLVIYKNKVIAGDLSSPDGEGFVRTFCDFKENE